MQHIADALQSIARQRGRGDASPLIMVRQLDSATGERVSHLPIEPDLAQAWVQITGEPFRPHQSQALAALRRRESVALRMLAPNAALSAHLLVCAAVLAEPDATALLITPDDQTAQAVADQLRRITARLPERLRLTVTLVQAGTRPDPSARLIVAAADVLHRRLLRHHERAWRSFWAGLRMLAVYDLHQATGVAAAHLADLVLRSQRVALRHTGSNTPAMLVTVADVADLEPALLSLFGHEWRVIAANDFAWPSTCVAVWQAGGQRLRETADLASALIRQGFQVHLACHPLDAAVLHATLGDADGLTIGTAPAPAQVLFLVGFPGSFVALRQTFYAGYQGVVLVLGDLPVEQALARRVSSLLQDAAQSWLPPPPNAYVTALHVLCAACESPLTAAEADAWGAQSVVDRLVAGGQLVDLPDPEVAWKPCGDDDPYAEFSLLSSSGAAITAQTEQGRVVAALDPTGFERWCFPGAALPPAAGGMRVIVRDDSTGSIVVRPEPSLRRTFPLRRCEVQVREERETRLLPGQYPIAWGRVVVNEETFGYREQAAGGTPTQQQLPQALHARWGGSACWLTLPQALNQQAGQLAGWSMSTALTLRNLAAWVDLVPCYDPITHRLYLIDAQPGGNGLAHRVYQTAEELLPLAYDVALACRTDPFLEPIARIDMDWLLTLLGRAAELPPERALVLDLPPRQRLPDASPPRSRAAPASEPNDLLADLFRSAPPRSFPPPALPERTTPEAPPPAPPDDDLLPPVSEPPRARPQPPADPPRASPGRGSSRPEHTQRSPRAPERKAPDSPRPDRRQPAPPPHDARRDAPPQPPPPASDAGSTPRQPAKALPSVPEPPPTPAEPMLDAAGLIERLRRKNQQHEPPRTPSARPPDRPAAPVVPRFAAGDQVFCLPYGNGVVRASLAEEGREILIVVFPEHGELRIDPGVSLVRKLEGHRGDDDDDLL